MLLRGNEFFLKQYRYTVDLSRIDIRLSRKKENMGALMTEIL